MGLTAKKIHFVGIGGVGMSALAKVLLGRGHSITGSDTNDTEITRRLTELGAKISLGQRGDLIDQSTELVVISAAIKPENKEYQVTEKMGIPIRKYADVLGETLIDHHSICIAGTHGKTSISSLLTWTLINAGVSPNFVIGGDVPQLAQVIKHDDTNNYFVAESCEYDRSFLNFKPSTALISNIEEDHLDYYKDLDDIVSAFAQFAGQIQTGGNLFYCIDCPNTAKMAQDCVANTISYGFDGRADYRGINVEVVDDIYTFDVKKHGEPFISVRLPIPGWHNVTNALGVIAICAEFKISAQKICEGLESFQGVQRRFQLIDEIDGITIVDDYAHHPTEIEAVIQTALHRYKGRKLYVIFQPHQYSRTRFLMADFAARLRVADQVILPEIFFVRDSERDKQLVGSADLAREIRKLGGHAVFIPTNEAITDHLINNLDPGDVVITMGAGNIWKVAHELLRRLQAFR